MSAGIANALLVCVKRRVRRARPCERARPRHFDVDPLAWFPSDRFSFPSGHALNAFAIGSVIALAFPSVALPVLAVAASVAASRVVLGLHWLSDVLAGALAGTLIGSVPSAALGSPRSLARDACSHTSRDELSGHGHALGLDLG